MIPPPPAIPGLKEAKGYHSYGIRKEDDQLKLIVFSDIDVAQVYRDTGLEVGDYVPHFHVGLNFGSPLSFLDPNGGCTLADLFAAKFEVDSQVAEHNPNPNPNPNEGVLPVEHPGAPC